jgi:MipA family protein
MARLTPAAKAGRAAAPVRLRSTRRLAGLLASLAAGLSAIAGAAHADQLPLWEAGVGLAAIDFPDYIGADERSSFVLPLPYLVYRGDVFRIDREGVRGLFFKSDRAELDVSVNASIPVESEDNQARTGMPDLDPTFEIGPTLDLTLYRGPTHGSALELRFPLRAVVATDFTHAQGAGFVFQPQLTLDLHQLTPLSGWRVGATIGPVFGDSRYHAYYYSVEPAFATPARPAYTARGGYGGTRLILSTSRRFPRFWVGAFVRYDQLGGAVFEDSPLVRQKQAFAAGIGVAWVLKRSGTLVEADD